MSCGTIFIVACGLTGLYFLYRTIKAAIREYENSADDY